MERIPRPGETSSVVEQILRLREERRLTEVGVQVSEEATIGALNRASVVAQGAPI